MIDVDAGVDTGTVDTGAPAASDAQIMTSMEGIVANLGEDYTDNATLSKFKDAEGLAKSYIDLEKLVGAKVEKIPGADAEEAELTEFYGKLGLKEGEDYGVTLPDDLSGLTGADGRLGAALAAAKTAGLSKHQAKVMFGEIMKYESADTATINEGNEASYNAGVESLKGEWGDGFSGMVNEITSFEKKLGVFDSFEAAGLNDNPVLLSALGKIAVQVGETSVIDKITSNTPAGKDLELSEVNSQIQDLLKADKSIPQHLTAKLAGLLG